MTKDLGISSSEYEWLLTIFYIAYIVFEWFALMWKVLPPHVWACFCVIGWGKFSVLSFNLIILAILLVWTIIASNSLRIVHHIPRVFLMKKYNY